MHNHLYEQFLWHHRYLRDEVDHYEETGMGELILYFKNPYFKELLARVKSLVGGVIGKFKKAK